MPSDTPQIMEAAENLAQLVAQHPAVQKYKQAQRAVSEDADASRLLADFDRQIQRLAQQQQAGMPVTDAQQEQLEGLQSKIVSHIKVKALNMAQVDYVDLRRRISAAIDSAVNPPAPGAAGAAPGGPGVARAPMPRP
jgi:cell fate (sporulation/competence/biofilm development) regulator YlbF (YheA/YmcA/DUF963 family)